MKILRAKEEVDTPVLATTSLPCLGSDFLLRLLVRWQDNSSLMFRKNLVLAFALLLPRILMKAPSFMLSHWPLQLEDFEKLMPFWPQHMGNLRERAIEKGQKWATPLATPQTFGDIPQPLNTKVWTPRNIVLSLKLNFLPFCVRWTNKHILNCFSRSFSPPVTLLPNLSVPNFEASAGHQCIFIHWVKLYILVCKLQWLRLQSILSEGQANPMRVWLEVWSKATTWLEWFYALPRWGKQWELALPSLRTTWLC